MAAITRRRSRKPGAPPDLLEAWMREPEAVEVDEEETPEPVLLVSVQVGAWRLHVELGRTQ
jgi:hypothetical protein